MNLIDPFDKTSAVAEGPQTRACMCNTNSTFNSGKGTDECFHCGCACGGTYYSSGNDFSAFITPWRS